MARSAGGHGQQRGGESGERLELETKVKRRFVKISQSLGRPLLLLRHYAKQMLTTLVVKLGCQHKGHKGRVGLLA